MDPIDPLSRPLLLETDNFTPRARTPWGGTRIAQRYKPGLCLSGTAPPVVGESWEVSVEPDFPSTVLGSGRALAEVLALDPARALGREHRGGRSSTALLVKLLDADDELSVQIHPSDDYAGLGPGEGGKPESWYVLDADPGAAIYLGLREGVTREQMAGTLAGGGDVSELLERVPALPGDFFVIAAGTAHAVGRGITLVEPQHVAPKKRGVTYRYWDWNRRYDARGHQDPKGEPRALHVEHALAVTDWDAPRGQALLATRRLRAGPAAVDATAKLDPLCGPGAPLTDGFLRIARISGTGTLPVPDHDALRALTVVQGSVRLIGQGFDMAVGTGQSAVLPACLTNVRAALEGAHALLCAVA